MESRIKKSSKNIKYSFLVQTIVYILSFVMRKVFVLFLSVEYLGVNGLFNNIISMLSLAELGIGTAMNYFLYKPIAEKNEEQVAKYLDFYRKAYTIVGAFVIVTGISSVPFLKYLVKDTSAIDNVKLIYILYILNSGISYFFSYKKAIVIADQKGYIESIYYLLSVLTYTSLQIVVLIFTHNFIIYLLVQIITTIVYNYLISKKVDKLYPFLLKNKDKSLSNEEKKDLFNYIGAMVSHKVGSVIVNGTDNILIANFVSLVSVGFYSNYSLVISAVKKVLSQIYNVLVASIGNLSATSDIKHKKLVFDRCFFINNWISCFCTVSLYSLLQIFISNFFGPKYLLDDNVVIVIVFNFYLISMRNPVQTFKNAAGQFWNDRYRPIAEALINLIVSIILVKQYGLSGIFIGTAISFLLTVFWIEPVILYKHSFKMSSAEYFYKYMINTVYTIFLCIISRTLIYNVQLSGYLSLIFGCFICIILPNVFYSIIFYRNEAFRYFKYLLLHAIFKRR